MTFKHTAMLLSAAFSALYLTGCATKAPISSRPDLAAMENTKGAAADKGLLIVDTTGNLNCASTKMGFYAKGGGFVSLTDHVGSEAGPAVKVVDPGKYSLFSGTCAKPGFYDSTLPSLRLWFGSVEVGAGEAVYAGTLSTDRVDVQSKLKGAGAVWSALNNFSTKKQSTYLTYQFSDQSSSIKNAVKSGEEVDQNLVEITERMVYRPPLAILDKGEYESAILRAYEKTPEGKTPTKDEVDIRFKEEIKVAIKNSLMKVGDQMGLSSKVINDVFEKTEASKT